MNIEFNVARYSGEGDLITTTPAKTREDAEVMRDAVNMTSDQALVFPVGVSIPAEIVR
jgi:hypothetical protein